MRTQYESLQAFRTELQRREDSKKDFVVAAGSMRMVESRSIGFGDPLDGNTYLLTDYAHGQVASRLGIPKQYYDRIGEIGGGQAGMTLRDVNVNRLFAEEAAKGTKYLTRVLDGKMRAVLSEKYHPIDDYLIVEGAALKALEAQKQPIEVKALSFSDSKLYMQVLFPRLVGEVKKGDVVQYGLTISNSEVGAGAVSIETLIWRLVCGNGAIGQSIFRKVHIGKRVEESELDVRNFFSDETVTAELKAFRLRLTDTIGNEINDAAFQQQIAKMRIAAGEPIHKPEETVKNVTKRWSLTEKVGEGVLASMINSQDYSRWGLANAVTAQAHDTKDADLQYTLEKVGGDIIELSPSEWEVVAA